ncbi:MAG: DUF362 domain-containing protein [Clostridiales bacterium]|nr:DUF362 domain-containing protein [Clostridiales bacterium]
MNKSKVFFTREITQQKLIEIYEKLGIKLDGRVAVKVHSGEVGNQNFIRPEFLKDIINSVNGTVVECNTAYEGQRNTTEKHIKAIAKHGWSNYFTVDILDAEEQMELPVKNGKHLKVNYVGKNMQNYDSMLVLSHFKGHPMGGFGGAIKNISIGLASSFGKAVIHGAGEPEKIWTADHDSFLESMVEASETILDYYKQKIVFINIMKNMSVDCDCCAKAKDPQIEDIGILASLDPLALDKACVDLVYASADEGKKHLIERIESRNGTHTLDYAIKRNLGNANYELVEF